MMELTTQLNPALQEAGTSCHTAAALRAGDLDTSFYNLSPLGPNIGDVLQSPMKLIPEVLETWGCSFKFSSVYQL